jgi:hypothetical protein
MTQNGLSHDTAVNLHACPFHIHIVCHPCLSVVDITAKMKDVMLVLTVNLGTSAPLEALAIMIIN